MSYTDIRQREGMPYGGMPIDALVRKLEETDPDLVADVANYDEFYDLEDAHNQYVRSEVIDWSPDQPRFESDAARRDPGLSRGFLNLRFNGTRGSDPELPQHPELFIGFTGNDPRGANTDPRFDEMRAHGTARARNLQVRMGHNVGHGGEGFQVAERPWTGPAINYAMKEIHRRTRDNYGNHFATEKEGRPWGRNFVADAVYGLRGRGEIMADGAAGLYSPEQGDPLFIQGDYGPATGLAAGAPRRVDRSGAADTAPWRRVLGDADLAVEKYGPSAAGGRGLLGVRGHGGGLADRASHDQDLAAERSGGDPRRDLAAGMGAAAASRRAAFRGGIHDAQAVPGTGLEAYHGAGVGGRGAAGAELAALAVRATVADQPARAVGVIGDAEGGRLGAAAGLRPAADVRAAAHGVVPGAGPSQAARLADAITVARGLREGDAAARRRALAQTKAGGLFGSEISREGFGRAANPAALADPGVGVGATEAPLARAAAARGLEVHSYRGTPLPGSAGRPELFSHGHGDGEFGVSRRGRDEGLRKPLPEFFSHTQNSGRVEGGVAFGRETAAGARVALPGDKNLRPTQFGAHAVNLPAGFDGDSWGSAGLESMA